jgi:hypothetical protein
MRSRLLYSALRSIERAAMLLLNTVLAFVPAVTVWLAASQLLAWFLFRTELRRPDLEESTAWHAIETTLVFLVFAGSVMVWIGLTILLQHVNK